MSQEKEKQLYHALFETIDVGCKQGQFLAKEWRKYDTTTISNIVAGLSLKSNRHCKAAYKLLQDNFLGEAAILLRSAYETTISMDYLYLFQEEKNNYLCWSDIIDYRNLAMWPRVSDIQSDTRDEIDSPSFGESLDQIKANLVNEINNHQDIDRAWLTKLEQDPSTILSYKKLPDMIAARKQRHQESGDENDLLGNEMIRFHIYRHGSSLVHPNWMAVLKYYLKPQGIQAPEIKQSHCLWSILAICEQNILDLFQVGFICQDELNGLYSLTNEIRTYLSE